MRKPTFLRRTISATLVSAAVLTALTMAQPAQAAPRTGSGSTPTHADRAALAAGSHRQAAPRVVTGRKAVDRLGTSHLDQLAAKSNLSRAQVEKQLLGDPTLKVSDQGTVQVGDALGGTGATVTTGSNDNSLLFPVGNTLYLHSRPSSPLKIYLDFNGNTTTGTVWNTPSWSNMASFTTPVWGRDNDPTTFNTAEASTIQQSYASVAEDFAPFNVDVTTQDPGIDGLRRSSTSDPSYGVRVVVGINNWLNVTNSGYAQIGAFNWINSDNPAFCFAGATTPTKQIAECISHETGHTVGLYHDGTATEAYYAGNANWAPIMGNPYGRPMTQWSSGQYPGANNTQNDLNVIGSYLGWAADDYVGTTATTAVLTPGTTRSGYISYGTGEYDAFTFTLASTRTINVQSWEWFQAVDPDLNQRVQITNSAGTVVATSNPTGTTRTNMNVTLPAGKYYAFVDGVGEGSLSAGYSSYASMGIFNILIQYV